MDPVDDELFIINGGFCEAIGTLFCIFLFKN